jgi:hypothetical protein
VTSDSPNYGRRVVARRYAHCIDCGEETVQWLSHVGRTSPGSYRGTRLQPAYVCSVCGRVNL